MNAIELLYRLLTRRCEQIDQAWARDSYSLASFPDIVLDKTSDLDLTPLGELDFLTPILTKPEVSNLQQLSSFSDLYIKLFDNGRFWVEILNWWGSDINIHDHDFAGIQFQLCGRSLNVDYAFEELESMGDVCFGRVSITGAKIWRRGDRSISLPGRRTPHNVCHLDRPTVSLLIRTHPQKRYGPQWNYFPPGVAGNYGIASPTFRKRVTALRLLSTGNAQRFREAFARHVQVSKPEELLFTLIKMIDILFEPQFMDVTAAIVADGDLLQERLVEAAAYHRAIEMLKAFRHRSDLPWNELVALAVVGSAFDAASIGAIASSLRKDNFDEDIMSLMCKMKSKSLDAQSAIDTAATLFGLDSRMMSAIQ
jgi:hypothetical protein